MSSLPDAELASRLAALRARIASAAARAGRAPSEIMLVGISKGQAAEKVAAAVAAGLRDAGESFAQEARAKIPRVAALLAQAGAAAPRWHFVGRLQRNKARVVAQLVDSVESLDRIELAHDLEAHRRVLERRLEVLLQVNLSGEPQKGGVPPEALPALLCACRELSALDVRGLMTVPAADEDPEAARPIFARLRELRDAQEDCVALPELSMGMSGDFEVAIEEGATRVRVGTALFGPREVRR